MKNFIIAIFLFASWNTYAEDICSPSSINGGEISFNGFFTVNNNLIESVQDAYGASEDIEYLWLWNPNNVALNNGNNGWVPIDGSNDNQYEISGITETTYFLRCARFVGCENYWGESNVVEVKVDLCRPQSITGGKIGFEGPYDPNDENVVHSVKPAKSLVDESLDIEYIWLSSLVNKPNTIGNPYWTIIEGSENQVEINIDGLTETTYFLRCARVVGCDEPFWGESNKVKVTIDVCKPQFIDGGEIAYDNPYNPNEENVIENVQAASSDFGDLDIEYIWLSSLVNTPNVVGNDDWNVVDGSENLLELEIDGLVETTYFIRCARVAGCDDYWGESNIVGVEVDVCASQFIDGGEIAYENPYNPNEDNVIENVEAAGSDFGDLDIEYIWLSSLVNTPNVVGNDDWSVVDGSENLLELEIDGLVETTYFIRCARVAGCDDYWGESNIVGVEVDVCAPQFIDGGEIAYDNPYNPNEENVIENVEVAGSDFGDLDIEYIWLSSLVNTPNVVGNDDWSVVDGSENLLELEIEGLVETTYFIRCARVAGCDDYWGESNIVGVEVDVCASQFIDGGEIAYENPYNPNEDNVIENVEAAGSDFGDLDIEYIWLSSLVNTPNVVGNDDWSVVDGSDNLLELEIDGLVETTYFIRCARVAGCDDYWGESNIVGVEVDVCAPEFISGGEIAFEGPYIPNDDNIIESVSPASSDFGDLELEYVWLSSLVNEPNVIGNDNWSEVEGSENQLELFIEGLTETTYFIRCARVAGCDIYWGESNIVGVEVDVCDVSFINPGEIAFEGPYIPNNDNTIISIEGASTEFEGLEVEYQWFMSSESGDEGDVVWEEVEGADGETLLIEELTETTLFVRRVRVQGCDEWADSNIVEVEVDFCDMANVDGGSISVEPPFGPVETISNVQEASSDLEEAEIEYLWFESNIDLGQGTFVWTPIEGSENLLDLTVEVTPEPFYYIRRARVVGCEEWSDSNIVNLVVDLCELELDGGSIEFEGPYDPDSEENVVVSLEPATSEFEDIEVEYLWFQTFTDPSDEEEEVEWEEFEASENSADLILEEISETTYLIRRARIVGCDGPFVAESNFVEITVGGSEGEGGPEGENLEFEFNNEITAPSRFMDANSILVYPMPLNSNQDATIEFDTNGHEQIVLRLLSMDGRVHYTQESNTNGTNRVVLSTLGIDPGMYLLEIDDGQRPVFKRILIN